MLKGIPPIISPELMKVMMEMGHGDELVLADGNFPASTCLGLRATLVSLNLSPGVVTCSQVLRALVSAVPFEAAQTMMYETAGPYALRKDPPVWNEYRAILKGARLGLRLKPVPRWDFYKLVAVPDHVLTIQTADQHLYANLLLTIGVRKR